MTPFTPPSLSSQTTVIDLIVRNHPGAMSHITGLFARRGFNLEAIACAPIEDGSRSRIRLLLADKPRLEQVERQLAKLHDVLAIEHRPDLGPEFFARMFQESRATFAPVAASASEWAKEVPRSEFRVLS